MKKLLLVLVILLTLCGCSKAEYSQVSNGSDLIYEGTSKLTKADLYKKLKLTGADAIENLIIEKIAEIEGIDVQAEEDALIEELKNAGYYDYYVAYYFGSEEALINYFHADTVLTALEKKEVNDNFDEYVTEYAPVKMQVVYFDDIETANKIIEDVNTGMTFAEAAVANGYAGEPSSQVYLDTDDAIPVEVKSYVNETNTLGISTVITSLSTTTDTDGNEVEAAKYYVLFIDSRDASEFKEDFLNVVLYEFNSDEFKTQLFQEHEVEYFDQDLYDLMGSGDSE